MLTSVIVRRFLGPLLLGALLAPVLAGLAAPASAASFPPSSKFLTLRTERLTLHFQKELLPMAHEAAALATEILEAHEARYHLRLPRLHIVLSDHEDEPNGFTSPLPYPLLHLRAAAPDGSDEFGNLESWMRVLLAHELAHSVHLEEAGGIVRVGRSVFGRAPFLFPNLATPGWMVEGLATYEETEATAFGRGRNPDSLMVRRMAALAGRYPGEDRVTSGLEHWPMGQAPYLFGEGFMRDLSARFGPETLPALARTHAQWPVPFLDELTSHQVTGATFYRRWKEFARSEAERFAAFAEARSARGLTSSRALTHRGVRQLGPRFSPDGRSLAYTSTTLARRRAIIVASLAGGGERRLIERNGGTTLAFTPDGRRLVYDDVDVHQLFSTRYDLHVVDLATGRHRRLTRGMRARYPDVSPDGTHVAFVRRRPDRSELAQVAIDGGGACELTISRPGTQWSGPRFSPDGRRLAASRWSEGGFVDVVIVDLASGEVRELMRDRARDIEPTWTPDGRQVVFRSDRDGVSNLYAWREADGALFRVTNVLGGAFTPAVSPDGKEIAFADYDARGYDLRLASFDLETLGPAEAFVDGYPAARPPPSAVAATTGSYRPLPAALPRFWSPFLQQTEHEWRLGGSTGGADPLLRHAWGLRVSRGFESRRVGGSAFYVYDRFRPRLFVAVEDDFDENEQRAFRDRRLTMRIGLPLSQSRRSSQELSLAWRRSREEVVEGGDDSFDLGGLELSWSLSHDAQQFPAGVSPSRGERLRIAVLKEDGAFGSDVSLAKALVDFRAYRRVFGASDVVAVRLAAGTTFGRRTFSRSFSVGGFPDSALTDVVETNHAVLRGYDDAAFSGRRFVSGTLEYRFPLLDVQRGAWSFPVFLQQVHGAVFSDAAQAFSGPFRLEKTRTAAGATLGADLFLWHALPLTTALSVARGLSAGGETRTYFRLGVTF